MKTYIVYEFGQDEELLSQKEIKAESKKDLKNIIEKSFEEDVRSLFEDTFNRKPTKVYEAKIRSTTGSGYAFSFNLYTSAWALGLVPEGTPTEEIDEYMGNTDEIKVSSKFAVVKIK